MNGRVWPWALAGPLSSVPQAKRRKRPQALDWAGLPGGLCAGLRGWGWGENLPGAGLHLSPPGIHRRHRVRRQSLPLATAQPPLCPACLHGLSLEVLGSPSG